MPYYYRKRYYPRRRRRYWRRGPRKTFRRRFWRRHRYYSYRVRKPKKKLKYLRLKEYQPYYINKLKIRGLLPLFITTDERRTNNYVIYKDEIAPHYIPSGGGFSVYTLTLNGLYENFTKIQNIWTRSNNTFPLIRYTGAKIQLYRSENADYIFTYHSCFPMKAKLETFQSCQPNLMQLNKRHKIIRCKKDNPYKKPYKTIKISPPGQITNKWFFQKEIADTPLLMTMCSAMSLDRFYSASTSISSTIGFKVLNPELFSYHNFVLFPSTGYKPNATLYLWSVENPSHSLSETPTKNLIYLGNSKEYKTGQAIKDIPQQTSQSATWDKYFESTTNWGNPFEPRYLNKEWPVLVSNYSPHELKTKIPISDNSKLGQWFTETDKELILECRYNPYNDKGNNHVFITPITHQSQEPWALPAQQKFRTDNLPLWAALFGFVDWEKLINAPVNVETDYICCIVSDYILPKLDYYIPIDQEMLDGRSKYQPKETRPQIFDLLHWYPKLKFQLTALNQIGSCGPGTIKLPPQVSAEAHCRYTLYFKLGGCGPPMETIENPEDQPVYPTPNNLIQSTSLQSPDEPIQYYLYKFDERRGQLTKKAAERITKYKETKKPSSTFAATNYFHPPIDHQTSEEDSSEEETEKETLQQLLLQQRVKQQKFKSRILHLIQQLQESK
nr:MAG: ORF1 [TTV-like mini virus]